MALIIFDPAKDKPVNLIGMNDPAYLAPSVK